METLALGQIVAFTNYLMATLQTAHHDAQLSNNWANGLASAKRINEVLDAEPEVAELPDATSLPSPIQGEIEFDHVGFTTMTIRTWLCSRISAPGQNPARQPQYLGATGSGKSSLVTSYPDFMMRAQPAYASIPEMYVP